MSKRPLFPTPPSNVGLVAPPDNGDVWRRVARTVLRPWCRLHVEGREHVPADGGVLIAANHRSHADSIALGLAVRKRALSFLGDERMTTQIKIVGPHLVALGMVPLTRGEADVETLNHVVELLRAGHAVVVYPEGSRSRTGEVHRPRSGVARIAAAAQVPVVPAGLSGTDRLWPIDGRPRLRGGRVHVRFGAPLLVAGSDGRARRALNDELHSALVALSGAVAANHFAPVRGGSPVQGES